MNSLMVMEWNEKPPALWDWDNVFMFGTKVTETPKKLQTTGWSIEGDQGMNSESVYSPGGDGGSGVSGSELRDGTSKSSKSGSVSSSVGESKKSNLSLEAFEGLPKDYVDNKQSAREVEAFVSSPTHDISAGSGEPLLTLKLGKRMYFEDVCVGNNAKASAVSVISTPIGTKAKRFKSIGPSTVATYCQVEGCNIDLSSAKDYHRKHKICLNHSKCPKVIVNGVERRFCQQCSRFHGLSEFDEKKRSCRRRLSDHNARRRKPQPGALRDSTRLSSSLYSTDERQQISIVLDQASCAYSRHATNLSWDAACSFRFTQTKDYFPNPANGGGTSKQLHFAENRTPNSLAMLYQDSCGLSPSKGTTSQVSNRGAEESMISFNLNAPQNLNHALSLLSTSSWASSEAKPVSLDNTNHSYHTNIPQPVMHTMTRDLPLSSEFWQNEQPSLHTTQLTVSNSQSNGSNQYQDLHLIKGPYEFGYNTNQFN
ncbi:squamosa promoter-binding-like protein 2 isoform X1 [Argentina anserina]|uniref:squamosa promoter-binding-like protein 2 isoform X1 n=1 Tax=Argentina anserina TaxID=57926 RepID=UPI0021764C72|nr:squamosa promoter-binding-like protein 2 isoform X1 [Potentilla anserina]